MPLDAEPSSAGNVLLHSDGTCQVWGTTLRPSLDETVIGQAGATWHTSHSTTCHADHHPSPGRTNE